MAAVVVVLLLSVLLVLTGDVGLVMGVMPVLMVPRCRVGVRGVGRWLFPRIFPQARRRRSFSSIVALSRLHAAATCTPRLR